MATAPLTGRPHRAMLINRALVSPGIDPAYICLPQSKNNNVYEYLVYCNRVKNVVNF
jgi:hypothetical protein